MTWTWLWDYFVVYILRLINIGFESHQLCRIVTCDITLADECDGMIAFCCCCECLNMREKINDELNFLRGEAVGQQIYNFKSNKLKRFSHLKKSLIQLKLNLNPHFRALCIRKPINYVGTKRNTEQDLFVKISRSSELI